MGVQANKDLLFALVQDQVLGLEDGNLRDCIYSRKGHHVGELMFSAWTEHASRMGVIAPILDLIQLIRKIVIIQLGSLILEVENFPTLSPTLRISQRLCCTSFCHKFVIKMEHHPIKLLWNLLLFSSCFGK